MHVLKTHASAGPLPLLPQHKGSLSETTMCRRVGHCMCGEDMVSRKVFRTSLVASLMKAFVKGSLPRQVYDVGLAVLKLY